MYTHDCAQLYVSVCDVVPHYRDINEPKETDRLTDLSRQTQEVRIYLSLIGHSNGLCLCALCQVKGVMSRNIDLVMQRGEKIEQSLEKAGKYM